MPKNEALQEMKKELHVSHSQIFTYLNCSLKYRFMYVEARPQERVSIALPFGTSIHASLERYYRSLKEKGAKEARTTPGDGTRMRHRHFPKTRCRTFTPCQRCWMNRYRTSES
jgi:CRISPR/Cas system-associated exonuclease Cas4 (RecB family)